MSIYYNIDKGIEPPLFHSGKHLILRNTLQKLAVGESFFLPTNEVNTSLRSIVSHHAKRLKRKFTLRSMDGGVRVWRLK